MQAPASQCMPLAVGKQETSRHCTLGLALSRQAPAAATSESCYRDGAVESLGQQQRPGSTVGLQAEARDPNPWQDPEYQCQSHRPAAASAWAVIECQCRARPRQPPARRRSPWHRGWQCRRGDRRPPQAGPGRQPESGLLVPVRGGTGTHCHGLGGRVTVPVPRTEPEPRRPGPNGPGQAQLDSDLPVTSMRRSSVSDTNRPPRRGLPRPNCHRDWLISYTLARDVASASLPARLVGCICQPM